MTKKEMTSILPWIIYDGHTMPEKEGYYYILKKENNSLRIENCRFVKKVSETLNIAERNTEYAEWLDDVKYPNGEFVSLFAERKCGINSSCLAYCPIDARKVGGYIRKQLFAKEDDGE